MTPLRFEQRGACALDVGRGKSAGHFSPVGDAESHLRDWPAALRAQGKPAPKTLPIGGAMRYRAVPA
jgi:hypothetical protein